MSVFMFRCMYRDDYYIASTIGLFTMLIIQNCLNLQLASIF